MVESTFFGCTGKAEVSENLIKRMDIKFYAISVRNSVNTTDVETARLRMPGLSDYSNLLD
jgi:hypothetical protein